MLVVLLKFGIRVDRDNTLGCIEAMISGISCSGLVDPDTPIDVQHESKESASQFYSNSPNTVDNSHRIIISPTFLPFP